MFSIYALHIQCAKMFEMLSKNTVVSEIIAGCNFREFRDKGRVRENLFAKFNMGGYKMAAFAKKDFR